MRWTEPDITRSAAAASASGIPAGVDEEPAVFASFEGGRFHPPHAGDIIVVCVSPEQKYYLQEDNLLAFGRLVMRFCGVSPCQIVVVIADTLQRYNLVTKPWDQLTAAEIDEATAAARNLGDVWERNHFPNLQLPEGTKIYRWDACIAADTFATELDSLHRRLESDSTLRESFLGTARQAANAAITAELISPSLKPTFVLNSEEKYLPEECAFLCALSSMPWLNSAQFTQKTYIMYPNRMNNAIKAIFNQRKSDTKWLWMPVVFKKRKWEENFKQAKEVIALCNSGGTSVPPEKLKKKVLFHVREILGTLHKETYPITPEEARQLIEQLLLGIHSPPRPPRGVAASSPQLAVGDEPSAKRALFSTEKSVEVRAISMLDSPRTLFGFRPPSLSPTDEGEGLPSPDVSPSGPSPKVR